MIEVQNLNKTYGRRGENANRVLRDVSFTLPDTGFVCILGPSGCGKTSLLNAIGGLDAFDNGTICAGDVKARRYGTALFEAERNRSFGYIFQNYYLLPEHSVGYNVYLGLHSLKLSHAEKLRRVLDALRAVEMDRYIRRSVGELSGGQQQRVAIARALARKPRVIFADEPTGNLDEANTINICTLLRRISKTSLVIMVTHEERIARFFADRIITLSSGRISDDTESWQRESLSQANSRSLYTGDYAETRLDTDRVKLRILQEEGAAPAEISILVLKDRVVIKLDDSRAVTCGSVSEQPALVEGHRPCITLEDVEKNDQVLLSLDGGENIPAKAGCGIRFRDMFLEALHMSREKGLKGLGTRLFLILLTVLTAISAADFIALSTIDPEDFIKTHSQVLEVQLKRGEDADESVLGMQALSSEFKSYLADSGLEYAYVPDVSSTASISGSPILQTSDLAIKLTNFSYAPLSILDGTTLILGRMPADPLEVVIDRWVLEAAMATDGVAQNGVTGIDYFLEKQVDLARQNVTLKIVGICDSGEPAVYLSNEAFTAIGLSGTPVAALSSLQAAYPGVYDDVTLGEDECIVLPRIAGSTFRDKLGANYNLNCKRSYVIVRSIEEGDFFAKIVVADSQISEILLAMSPQRFWIYCKDKGAMTAYLKSIPEQMGNTVTVTVKDDYSARMKEYRQASHLRADARTIVTATIMVLSMVMLYLLRRSQVYARIGMLSVYRLLGIPGRKICGIFAIESVFSTLVTALPAAAGTWLVITVLKLFPDIAPDLILPWQTALLVYAGITCFHLAVSLLPLLRLLKLPPARLAAKFDF